MDLIEKYIGEGKFNYKKGTKAHLIVTDIISWPDWYYTDVPQKSLVSDLMKKFKIDKKKVIYIFDIWDDFRKGKINSMEFQDFTHMVLQGEEYTGY